MRRMFLVLLGTSLLAWSAAAQTQIGTQTTGSAGASVQTDKQGAQAGADASASAGVDAGVGGQQKDDQQKSRGEARGSGRSSSSAQAGSGSAALESGTTIDAVLRKSVDARKAKVGDTVAARNRNDVKSGGEVVIPRNSLLLGRVTQVQARGKGQSESSLGIVFDRAQLKDGREIPLNVAIRAVGAARSAAAVSSDDSFAASRGSGSAAASGGGGLVGGVGSTAGAATGVAGSAGEVAGGVGNTAGATLGAGAGTVASTTGSAAGATLNPGSTGVVGIPGLRLESALSSQTQGQVLTSSAGNVKLESGTQLVLFVVAEP